jgi:hypothetical protein
MSTTLKARSPTAGPQKAQRSVLSDLLSVSSSIFAVIYTPRLIPLLVYATFFPLLILVSLGAGYFVWSSLSVSWQVPLYLQYGCVPYKVLIE